MKIPVKQLRSFIAVTEAGSIAGALPTLNVLQPVAEPFLVVVGKHARTHGNS